MLKRKNLKEVIYIEIDKIYSIIVILLLLSLMIFLMNFISIKITLSVIKVLSIIISISIMMITNTLHNKSNNKSFYFLTSTFFIASIFNIIDFISKETINVYDDKMLRFSYIFPKLLISIMLFMNLYFINNGKKTNTKIKYWTTIACVFLLCFIINSFINDFYTLNIYIIGISISFLLFASIKNRKFGLLKANKLNYMYFYVNFLLISITVRSINIIVLKNITTNIIHEYINLMAFTVFFGCILQQLLNNSYNTTFKDMHTRNNSLSELNSKIMGKSMELEFSQKILSKREDMFKNLFKNIPIPMLLLNLSNGRILFSNPAFLSITQISGLKKVINKKILEFVKFDDIKIFKEETYKINFGKIYEAELINRGEKTCLEIQFLEISKEDEQCLVLITDITEKMNMYEIKTRVDHKKIEEKLRSDFLSNISHDLKIPINVIYSAAQLEKLLISNGNIDEVKKYQRIAKDNCISLIRLTNNLIDHSRLSSDFLKPSLEYCNLVEIIEDTIMKLVEYVKGSKIDLIFDTNEEEVYLYLDRDFMERIILNLISNALKYTPRNGKILVEVEDSEKSVVIKVEDNGVGMEEEFVNSAFTRYARGKNNEYVREKGTGIGLFVVKNLMELQNGGIEIKSKVGKGTSIFLSFNKELKENEHI